MARALLLFSGGLDSLLSYKILERQGAEVLALFFRTHFFTETKAREIAEANNLKLRVEDVGDEHLGIVKAPRFGRGKRMNPCIDCHLFMIKKAKEIMEREGFDFVATGEVLGQRPMSQNLGALMKIEKEAGLAGKIVRPLSAKLLPETEAEARGVIVREKLGAISGRSREGQLALVKELGIKKFESPAGGCLLTDPAYSARLAELAGNWPDYTGDDVALLRCGRIYWHENKMMVVARDQEECATLEKFARAEDLLVSLADIPGPMCLARGEGIDEATIERAMELTTKHAPKARGEKILKVRLKLGKEEKIRGIMPVSG
jgi:tRNA-specific 2-thiouridylase